ncbi:hypothetical protein GCM10010254_29330 [Streptomyces chromofuscus]|nr:hypothetical protein GCM10010254_29330 [Streptomyces chromofuscus]
MRNPDRRRVGAGGRFALVEAGLLPPAARTVRLPDAVSHALREGRPAASHVLREGRPAASHVLREGRRGLAPARACGAHTPREVALRGGGHGYPTAMDRMDHLEHLDKHLVDELAQVARETIRDELRQQTRKQRRKATLYAASGAVALYAGAAVALAVGLALAAVLPDWAAALITAAILAVVAYLLRGAARPHAPGTPHGRAEMAADRAHGAAPPVGPGNAPYPPVPSAPPTPPGRATAPTDAPGADTPGPGAPAPGPLLRPDRIDPENPHHRA